MSKCTAQKRTCEHVWPRKDHCTVWNCPNHYSKCDEHKTTGT